MEEMKIVSPLAGKIVPLSKIPEQQYARGDMGPGVAILPKEDILVAPFNGTVIAVSHTGHAMLLESSEGVRLRIQIAMDSGLLHNDVFSTIVESGEPMERGQILMRFDRRKIKRMGYKLYSPVVVENAEEFSISEIKSKGRVAFLEEIMHLIRKEWVESGL